jgi:hypothetical protein
VDKTADADGDGFTTEQEFTAGTDPLVSSSRPVSHAPTGSVCGVEIETCAGREYWLEWTDNLLAPDWEPVDDSEREGDGTPQVLTDPEADDITNRYYRTGIRLLNSSWPL